MQRSRMNANESSAISTLKVIGIAQITFMASPVLDEDNDGQGEYAPTLRDLQSPPGGGPSFLGDEALASTGQKAGYTFTLTVGPDPEQNFTIHADPIRPGQTGIQHFFTDESMVFRGNPNGPAGPSDPPLS